MANNNSQPIYPYVSCTIFLEFIRHLHETLVTAQIDNSMMPKHFSGNSRTAVTSAFKSLGLTDAKNNTTQKLKDLVNAYQGKDWSTKLKEHILSFYTNIPDSYDLKTITKKQLDTAFGDMSSQMLEKSIRFYLMINKEAGIEYSDHFKVRIRSRRRKYSPKKYAEEVQKNERTPSYMYDLNIPGVPGSFIRVPIDVTEKQIALVKAAVTFIELMATQNEESK